MSIHARIEAELAEFKQHVKDSMKDMEKRINERVDRISEVLDLLMEVVLGEEKKDG